VVLSFEAKRAKLARIIAQNPQLTLAARQGESMDETEMTDTWLIWPSSGLRTRLLRMSRSVTRAEVCLLGLGITEPREIDVRAIAHEAGAAVRIRN
jgi:hypothetical protein